MVFGKINISSLKDTKFNHVIEKNFYHDMLCKTLKFWLQWNKFLFHICEY